jgi:hypothetical protein
MFDICSDVDICDENPFGACVHNDDYPTEELRLFRAGVRLDLSALRRDALWFGNHASDVYGDAAAWNVGVDFGMVDDVPFERFAATARLAVVLDGLEASLTTDAIVRHDIEASHVGEIFDLNFARLLFQKRSLRDAVASVDESDFEAHESGRGDLLALARVANTPPQLVTKEERNSVRRPKDTLRSVIEALRDLLRCYELGENRTCAMHAYRSAKAGPWVLRLTERRALLKELPPNRKLIIASATLTPEEAGLAFSIPTDNTWWVYRPTLAVPERRTVVADRTYSRHSLLTGKGSDVLRGDTFSLIRDGIITKARRAPGLPVAVLGPSAVMNEFLQFMLGDQARAYHMPFDGGRHRKTAGLRELTLPLGFLAGYIGALSGSNDFSVVEDGVTRFTRSVVILGNPVPNLAAFARDHRGLYVGVTAQVPLEHDHGFGFGREENVLVDWTPGFRHGVFAGSEEDGTVMVSRNAIGYRSHEANALLHGAYVAEMLQAIGRGRFVIPDAVDPSIEPEVFIFGSVPIPGWPVSEVVTLGDLRERFGLEVREGLQRGRPSRLPLDAQLRRRFGKDGARKAIRWLVHHVRAEAGHLSHVRFLLEDAGLWKPEYRDIASAEWDASQ